LAIYYIRPISGNDASAGTSFATAWRTISLGATLARIAPGDTIRIEKSPDPTSLGQTVLWTNKSTALVLNTAVTTNISTCETAWTASANVTTTTTATRKEGSLAMQATVAAGFVTGMACYLDLGGVTDFSAYQQVSFWIKSSVTATASQITLTLCSDAAGATPVDTCTLDVDLKANQWVPIVYDKGSALGSSIQSVALNITADFGATVITLDNILACKASSAADSLTLRSLIGKNTGTESWWIIRSINGTAVTLDINAQTTAGTSSRGYSGTTETVTTYKRESWIITRTDGTSINVINDSGTLGNLITFSGGWDSTAMSSQTGDTFFDGLHSNNNLIDSNSQSFVKIDKISGVRGAIPIQFNGGSGNVISNASAIGGATQGINGVTSAAGNITFEGNIFSNQNNSNGILTNCKALILGSANIYTRSNQSDGWNNTSSTGPVYHTGTVIASNNGSEGVENASSGRIGNVTASDNATSGFVNTSLVGPLDIESITGAGNTQYTLNNSTPAAFVRVKNGFTSSTAGLAAVNVSNPVGGQLILNDAVYSEATFLSSTSVIQGTNSQVITTNENASAGVNITRTDGGTIRTDVGADRYNGTGVAIKISPTATYRDTYYPLRYTSKPIAVRSGALVTLTCQVKRSVAANINARIVIPSNIVGGVGTSDLVATAAAADNTYAALILTFTPTENGAFIFYFEAYGGTTDHAWLGHVSVTQA
jgi:hypothetical protein